MLTLRQLEIFLAVAQRQHVTAAAAAVHLSQSAVSAALAALSEQLGGPLFDRQGRRLLLNDRGRQLVDDAQDLLGRAGQLQDRFTGHGALAGRLRLGASSTIGAYLLPDLLGRWLRERPAVHVDLAIANTAAIETQLADRTLDLAFLEGPPQNPQVAAIPWRTDELLVFVPPDHPLAARGALPLAAVAEQRWALREAGSGTRSVFDTALQRHGLQPGPHSTFGNGEALKQAVRAGLGIGCLSRLAVQRELQAGEFVPLRVPGLDLRRTLWRVTRRGAFPSELLLACLQHFDTPPPAAPRRAKVRRS